MAHNRPMRNTFTRAKRGRAWPAAWLLCAGLLHSPGLQAHGARASASHVSEGRMSFYGHALAGQATASGERFNPHELTMAHKTLPFGTLVRVTNLANNHSVVVRVNDRGPWLAGRIGDLSRAAAEKLRMLRAGVARTRMEVLGMGPAEPAPLKAE